MRSTTSFFGILLASALAAVSAGASDRAADFTRISDVPEWQVDVAHATSAVRIGQGTVRPVRTVERSQPRILSGQAPRVVTTTRARLNVARLFTLVQCGSLSSRATTIPPPAIA